MLILLCITTLDGSQVNLKVPITTVLEYQTPYGDLKIPISDMRHCDLGVHPRDQYAILGHIQNLGSAEYAQRETASKYLALCLRDAQHELAKATKNDNPERAKRAELLLRGLLAPEPANDTLATVSGKLEGYITNKDIVGVSASLGKITVPICTIKSIQAYTLKTTVRVSANGDWHSAGYLSESSLTMTADGEASMWPINGQGNYVCGPDGLQDGTMHEGYPAGALVGRIKGRTFLIGKSFQAANMSHGELELRIIPTGWTGGQQPTGFYEVTIK